VKQAPGTPSPERGEDLARQFRGFVGPLADDSPLYARLSAAVAEDPALLALSDMARQGQMRPNMLFAAVRLLLMSHPDDPLASWHPDIGRRAPAGDPVGQLREFCARHRDALVEILRTRLVQTNEPLRSAILRVALQEVQRRANAPLAVVDVGASLGVNLCSDRVACDYGDGVLRGDPESPLQLACELRGPNQPRLDAPLDIVWRRGIDLDPIDPDDTAAVAWLRALIWPGDTSRLGRLMDAVELVRRVRPPVLKGNAAELLEEVCDLAPKGAHLCVISTFVRMHQTPADRAAMDAQLTRVAMRRSVSWVTTAALSDDGEGEGVPLVLRDPAGAHAEERLAIHHPHGRWLQWAIAERRVG
jgi:hypothetical protein